MEFIKVEEFNKQDKEVRNALLEWWIPQRGDSCYHIIDNWMFICDRYFEKYDTDNKLIKYIEYNNFPTYNTYYKEGNIPLLTMQQIIDFIEDKTNKKVIFEYTCCGNIVIKLLEQDKVTGSLVYKQKYTFLKDKFDLLHTLFQVAIDIIKEEIR